MDFESSLKTLHDTEKENKVSYEKLLAAKRDLAHTSCAHLLSGEEIDAAKAQMKTKKEGTKLA